MKRCKLLLILILPLTVLNKDVHKTTLQNIFSLKESVYGVLFYLDSCLACRNSKLFLLEQQNRGGISVYFIDYSTCDFKIENETNLFVDDYVKIYIKVTPTLLIVENRMIVAELIGYKDIINYYQKSFYFSSL